MKKIIIILLLMCVISAIYFMMQSSNINIGDDYAEDAKLVSSELYALCDKSGQFLIRERISNNTYKAYLLNENAFDGKLGNYYDIDESTKIDYGKEALNKTYLLKLNKNALANVKVCREGAVYTWRYYQDAYNNIYIPYPYFTHSEDPDPEIYYQTEIKILDIPSGETPDSIIYRYEKTINQVERKEKNYTAREFETILSRAKKIYIDYENLYKASNQITEDKYKEILYLGFEELELKYSNRVLTIFHLMDKEYEVEAVIKENGNYYEVPRGILDEWYVNTLFSTIDLFQVDPYKY